MQSPPVEEFRYTMLRPAVAIILATIVFLVMSTRVVNHWSELGLNWPTVQLSLQLLILAGIAARSTYVLFHRRPLVSLDSEGLTVPCVATVQWGDIIETRVITDRNFAKRWLLLAIRPDSAAVTALSQLRLPYAHEAVGTTSELRWLIPLAWLPKKRLIAAVERRLAEARAHSCP